MENVEIFFDLRMKNRNFGSAEQFEWQQEEHAQGGNALPISQLTYLPHAMKVS